jgi:hypothetical protein
MASAKAKSKSSGNSLECQWCSKSFKSESTLAAHMCPRKRRWTDRNLTHVRLGYQAFNRFYDLSMKQSRPKSMEEFICSPYYNDFVKFGRACCENNYIDTAGFTDWLIEQSVKLNQWCKELVYKRYLLMYIKHELGLRALERSVEYLAEWSSETGDDWTHYFAQVSTPRAVHDIRSGRLSPWIVYLSDTGDQLLTRFSEEQWAMIGDLLDPEFWMPLFQSNPDTTKTVQQLCKEAKI